MKVQMRALAREGAQIRLRELRKEGQRIRALFPEVAEADRLAKLRANIAKARAVKAKLHEQKG